MDEQIFIGRKGQLKKVIKTITSSPENGLSVILVTGESGIGKTRFLKEVYTEVENLTFSFWFSGKFDAISMLKSFALNYTYFIQLFWNAFKQEELSYIVDYIPDLAPFLLHKQTKTDGNQKISLRQLTTKFIETLSIERPLVIFIDDFEPEISNFLKEIIVRFYTHPLTIILSSTNRDFNQVKIDDVITLGGFNKSEISEFIMEKGLSLDEKEVAEISEITRGNPLLLYIAVEKKKREGEITLSSMEEAICEIVKDKIHDEDNAQKVAALFISFHEPLSMNEIQYLTGLSSKTIGKFVSAGLLRATPDGKFTLFHPTLTNCFTIKDINKYRHDFSLKMIRRRELWFHANKALLDHPPPPSLINDWIELLKFMYSRYLSNGKHKDAIDILEALLELINDNEEREKFLFEYGQLIVDSKPDSPKADRIIDELNNIKFRSKLMVKRGIYYLLNNMSEKTLQIIKEMKKKAQSRWEIDYANYLDLVRRSYIPKNSSHEIIREYEEFIEHTPFDDLKEKAVLAMLGRKACLNGWREVVDNFEKWKDYKLDGHNLIILANSACHTGDLKTARLAIARYRKEFLPMVAPIEYLNYLAITLVYLFFKGGHKCFYETLKYFNDVSRYFPNLLLTQEVRRAELYHSKELGMIDRVEEIFTSHKWIDFGCYPTGWFDRFMLIEDAWIKAHEGDLEEAYKNLKEIEKEIDLESLEAFAILDFYRLKGFIEWKRGKKKRAEAIWDEGIKKFKEWRLMSLLMFFYRFVAMVTGKRKYRNEWRRLTLEMDAPGWYDDPDNTKRTLLMRGNKIKVHTLGKFKVDTPWGSRALTVKDIKYKKSLDVIGVLIAEGRRGINRKELLVKIWPEQSSTNPLDIAISNLKSLIWKDFTITEHGKIKLNYQYLWIDVIEFERLANLGLKEPDTRKSIELLQQAVKLYDGPFMPDARSYDVEIFRSMLSTLHRNAAIKLAKIWLMNREPIRAAKTIYRVLKEDMIDEEANLLLLKAYYMMGARELVKRHYDRFRELYLQEIGTEPEGDILDYINAPQIT